jgi:Concanavalin A-like lectin/glucanases superfamily
MSSRIFRAAVLAALVLAAAAVDAQVNLSNGLVAQYRLAGNATDTGSQAQNGTVFGSVTFPTGVVGKFNPVPSDSTGYIDAPPVLNRDTSFTVSAWVRPTYHDLASTSPSQIVFERSSAASDTCGVNSAGNFGAGLYQGQYSFETSTLSGSTCTLRRIFAPASVTVNSWSHVLGIYDKSVGLQSLYVNGLLLAQVSAGTTLRTAADSRLKISRNSSSANQAFHGDMADIRVYDRVVTADEIASLTAMTPLLTTWEARPQNGTWSAANVSESSGVLSFAGTLATTYSEYRNVLSTPVPGDAVRLKIRASCNPCSSPNEVYITLSNQQAQTNGGAAAKYIGLGAATSGAADRLNVLGAITSTTSSFSDTTAYHEYIIEVQNGRAIYQQDGATKVNVAYTGPLGPMDTISLSFLGKGQFEAASVAVEQLSAAAVSGTCGTANNVAAATAPTTNLCATGTATPVTGTGPWSWTCNGSGGGTNAGCSAPSNAPPECAASTVATIAHVDLTASMTVANALNYGTFRQTFNVTCANGRFGVVRLPGVLLGAIVGTGGAYALVQSACATKPVQTIASPPATSAQISTAMATKNNQSALLADPLVGPLAAWVCQ